MMFLPKTSGIGSKLDFNVTVNAIDAININLLKLSC